MVEPTGERLARIETSVENIQTNVATLRGHTTALLGRVSALEASRNGQRRRQVGWMGGSALGGGGVLWIIMQVVEALK